MIGRKRRGTRKWGLTCQSRAGSAPVTTPTPGVTSPSPWITRWVYHHAEWELVFLPHPT